ncbi:MAG: hypothetical protein AYP45_01545 [Candidatus Brocadia carolinensis]|uniref:Uncharacterized protein n=1 Tax=Candidatus Brocadia carolinensis TaxID=1004156 RepID=A0A1V4AXM4_9BACT|nr:MAG: hypothetical protein AYP45_01545 [Candidatus Brocadia caroliniensis]
MSYYTKLNKEIKTPEGVSLLRQESERWTERMIADVPGEEKYHMKLFSIEDTIELLRQLNEWQVDTFEGKLTEQCHKDLISSENSAESLLKRLKPERLED